MRKTLQKALVTSASPVAVTSTQTYTTTFIPIYSFESYGIQLVFTGSPVATVTLEFSMDLVPQNNLSPGVTPLQPTVFDTVPNTTISTSAVSGGVITYDNIHTSANWIRLKWVNASGSGSITSITLVAKGSLV